MEIVVFLVIILMLFGASWFLLPFFLRKRAEAKLEARCSQSKTIVLSYDDGPGLLVTPRLLNLLDQENVKASFFVLGRNAIAGEAVVTRLVNAGHDVGSHTFNHYNAWKTLPWSANKDLRAGIRVLKDAGGNQFLFRPPFGKMTLAGLWLCQKLRLQTVWWTIDSRDSWQRRSIDEVIAEIAAKNGGVVLMHDFDQYEKVKQHPNHGDHVLALTQAIISLAREKHYRIVPYSKLWEDAPQVAAR